jgi:hypothetical protein
MICIEAAYVAFPVEAFEALMPYPLYHLE